MNATTRGFATVTLALGFATLPVIATAEIFKCTAKDGKTSYQQTPCAATQTESKVTIAGPKWEQLFEWREGGAAWVTFLDTSRITNQGFNKHIFLRTELQDNDKVLASIVTEELFDCENLRSMVLKLDGQERSDKRTPTWTTLDSDSRTRDRAQKIKAKVCAR